MNDINRRGLQSWAAPIIFLLLASAAGALAQISGKVVGFHDGDTITLLDVNRKQIKARLAGVGAPELKQDLSRRRNGISPISCSGNP